MNYFAIATGDKEIEFKLATSLTGGAIHIMPVEELTHVKNVYSLCNGTSYDAGAQSLTDIAGFVKAGVRRQPICQNCIRALGTKYGISYERFVKAVEGDKTKTVEHICSELEKGKEMAEFVIKRGGEDYRFKPVTTKTGLSVHLVTSLHPEGAYSDYSLCCAASSYRGMKDVPDLKDFAYQLICCNCLARLKTQYGFTADQLEEAIDESATQLELDTIYESGTAAQFKTSAEKVESGVYFHATQQKDDTKWRLLPVCFDTVEDAEADMRHTMQVSECDKVAVLRAVSVISLTRKIVNSAKDLD